MKKNLHAFTIVEVAVVVSIITILLGVVAAGVSGVRARARDAQVKTDKQNLILALVKAREASPTYSYPGLSGWQCIKSSGSCWKGTLIGGSAVPAAITQYLPGGVIPIPPGTNTGEYRTGAYVYNPTPSTQGSVTASFLVWSQERQILPGECYGNILELDPGIWYCYEALPR